MIKKLLAFQLNWLSPAFFSSLGGLFGGGSAPDAPTLAELTAGKHRTRGTLFNTSYAFDPYTKRGTSSVGFTGTGQTLDEGYGGLFNRAVDDFNDFDIGGYADERYQMMENILGHDMMASQNRLFDRVAGMTGGLGATSGGRDLLSRGSAEMDMNRQRTMLNLFNQGENREQSLFNRVGTAGNNWANFNLLGENAMQRDVNQWNNLSKIVGGQRQMQYEADLQDAADGSAFWSGIGGLVDMGLNYATGGASSLFSPAAAIPSAYGNSGGWFMGTQY